MKFYGVVIAVCLCISVAGQDLKELTLTFTKSASVRLGKEWDLSYKSLEAPPLTIVLKDNILKGTLGNGKVWGEFKVLKTKFVEEKDGEKYYNIFIEDDGEVQTLIYTVTMSPTAKHELLLPLVTRGQVTAYLYYR